MKTKAPYLESTPVAARSIFVCSSDKRARRSGGICTATTSFALAARTAFRTSAIDSNNVEALVFVTSCLCVVGDVCGWNVCGWEYVWLGMSMCMAMRTSMCVCV